MLQSVCVHLCMCARSSAHVHAHTLQGSTMKIRTRWSTPSQLTTRMFTCANTHPPARPHPYICARTGARMHVQGSVDFVLAMQTSQVLLRAARRPPLATPSPCLRACSGRRGRCGITYIIIIIYEIPRTLRYDICHDSYM